MKVPINDVEETSVGQTENMPPLREEAREHWNTVRRVNGTSDHVISATGASDHHHLTI